MTMQRLHPASQRRRKCYGLELRILKQVPLAFLLSGLMIYATTLAAHWLLDDKKAAGYLKQSEFIDIIAISSLITIWTAIFTVAIGAITVYIMKGPVYTADSLELIDSDQPLSKSHDGKKDTE